MRDPQLRQPSVVRRLVEAVARELAELWARLRRVYDDAFVETADRRDDDDP